MSSAIIRKFLDHAERYREPIQLFLVNGTNLNGLVLGQDENSFVLARRGTAIIVRFDCVTTFNFDSPDASNRYWSTLGVGRLAVDPAAAL